MSDLKYVAVYANNATRDTQVCKVDPTSDAAWEDDDNWEDVEDAEVFVGIFSGPSEKAVLNMVVVQENCHEDDIRLIPIVDENIRKAVVDRCAVTGGPCCMCKPRPCKS